MVIMTVIMIIMIIMLIVFSQANSILYLSLGARVNVFSSKPNIGLYNPKY